MGVVTTTSHASEEGAERGDAHAWAAFASVDSREGFCRAWLTLQCSMVADVRAGLLLLRDDAGRAYVPAAVWPDPRRDLSYLTNAAEQALAQRRGTVLGLDAAERERVEQGTVHVAFPVAIDAEVLGAVVLDLLVRPEPLLQDVLRQLYWGTGWLEALLRRNRAGRDAQVLERASIGLDLVQAAQEPRRLAQAAMAVVNELATHAGADRVSLGIERKGRLKLCAMSRTAWFDRKSQLVEAIENAMEEAIDQEASVAFPVTVRERGFVCVAQRDLAARTGAAAVLSVPLVSGGRPIGALTLERDQGGAFDGVATTLAETIGELLGPTLEAKLEHERWLSGRVPEKFAQWRDDLVGPHRPLFKLSVLLALSVLLFLIVADGTFRVSAKTSVEGAVQRAAVAPFDGFIAQALVRAGDKVHAGQVLAVLDDRDFRLEQVRWESEREQVASKYREAFARHDRANARILAAQLNQADAQVALAEEKLARTRLVAPFDGMVVSGDLSQLLGAPIEQGKVLFELAPLDAYRVVLEVDERDIAFVKVAQRGELALTGIAGSTPSFTVRSVTSVSTPREGRNFFRVEAQLEDASVSVRPGMEGIGKVEVGERRLIWIRTRNFVNWMRVSLWAWLP